MNPFFRILFIFLSGLSFHALDAQEWTRVAPGIWKASVGAIPDISLLRAAGAEPNLEALEQLPEVEFPLPTDRISLEVIDGQVHLRFPLEREEELYGLGLQFKTHNQRGRIMELHVDHYGGADNGRTHAPVPFYVSTAGYGVLVDAARYLTVYAGTAIRVEADDPPLLQDRNTDKQWAAQPYSDAVEILVPAAGTEVYIFGGPSMLKAVQRYNLFNGGGCLPPKWGLGFTQRVPTLYSDSDILQEVADFADHDFPLDFIGVEPGWHSMAYPCTFEWDEGRFPDPKGFLEKLRERGVRANLWLNPYLSPRGSMYPEIKPLSGSHTVWNGLVPDFTLEKARQLYKDHFTEHHIDLGVSGYKIDEVDGYDRWVWPDVATFPSGTSAEEMRQIYGLMVQRMTADWFREKNRRTYGLVRASNAGASSFPYVVYNDYYSHKDFITALINSSFIGVLWTPEVRASKTSEEWLRRMQSVCFSPMAMLNAWADGTKPWTFPEVEDEVRAVAQLRMRLLPYLYTAFARYRSEGIPPFRAMQLWENSDFRSEQRGGNLSSDRNPYGEYASKEIRYQYLMGDAMLVAPMFEGEESRSVVLPPGKWYDFYTGAYVGAGEVITVTPGLDQIPLFVRDGGIVPMIASRNQMPGPDEILPLEIRHYGQSPGSSRLYDDDGTTFDYERGAFSWADLRVKRQGNQLRGSMRIDNPEFFHYREAVNWVFMTRP
ncbi:TIM-barrel domain-containing protein [Flavilitoribacter nigricans]|uniref:ABC transporter substrate-binding protein n=1 Tax=Flavilitoribacter nigricans (strain ATCC 23147 / DSM 23189 / NBRC 102662 / NCIMB 1420 / SS-2) TaxID=1122177 RepID=A0A2D0NDW8_FLAN2|nr:TIM-barrel domain-containing protein [Flavilitoribacter nigricans]PHN06566.1 ABC transporter substrate-binding protein [Flavilitoribacter nigricans DSM 23189 = NBRC 102662]